jgi:DNA-binding FadR family transcriptional regulator
MAIAAFRQDRASGRRRGCPPPSSDARALDTDRLFHVRIAEASSNSALRRHMDATHRRYNKEWSVGN